MVPTTPIVLILLAAELFAWFAYFFALNVPGEGIRTMAFAVKFVMLVAPAAIMMFTLILAVLNVRVVWLSWALLAVAIALLALAIPHYRRARNDSRARSRAVAEWRARR